MLSTLDAARHERSLRQTQISNDFQCLLYRVQCRQTLAVVARRVRCRHGVILLSRRNKATSASNRRPSAPRVLSSAGKLIQYLHGSSFFPYCSADVFLLFFIRHLYLSVTRLSCSLNPLSSTSWVDTPLTADWLPVFFGTRPRLGFLKGFWKITHPTFNNFLCCILKRLSTVYSVSFVNVNKSWQFVDSNKTNCITDPC